MKFQFGQQVFVSSDGGDEVGEGVLQSRQSDKAFVVHVVVEVMLGSVDECADLLESFEVPYGGAVEESEDHVYVVSESYSSFLLVADEVYHHVCLVVADGDGDVAFMDDTQGQGGIGCA